MTAIARARRAHPAVAHLPALGLWTLGWAFFFAPLLLGRAHIANGDFSGQFHAFGLFQAREMAAGRLPLWSPGSFGGFPFAADPQSAVFYPLRWLTIVFSLPWGFPYYALQLEAMAHVWLAGAFTYLLAYELTGRRPAALLAAVAFGLGGYLTSYPILQLAILETIAWLPLALLLARRAVVRGPAVPLLAAAGLALALAALAGHPQTLLHVAYTVAAYYLFLSWRIGWGLVDTLKRGLLLGAIALGASAVAWLPALRYAATTARAGVGYEFVSTGFPLIDYLQTVAPGALTLWSPQYVGLAALFFAALALFGRRRADTADPALGGGVARAEIAFWGVVALLAAWLSLGDNGILFELVHRIAPGFTLFRQQERLAGLFSLALALLAAQGLALWARGRAEDRPSPSRAAWRAGLLVGGLLLLAGVTLAAMRGQAAVDWPMLWARQWALFAMLAAVVWLGRRRERATAAVVLLLALDLFIAARPAHLMTPGAPSAFWPRPAWLQPLLASSGRLDSQNLFHANFGEIYGLQDIRGISPLKPSAVARYEELPRRLRWQLLNVTHVLASEPLEPGLTPVASIAESITPGETLEATVYRFDDALPRAWLSFEPLVAPDDAAALALVQSADFDPAQQVVLLAGDAPAVATNEADPNNMVSVTPHPRGLDIAVETAAPGILVISEFARDGWHVTLDGAAQPPLEANAGLMAVPVSAGSHVVTLRFRPLDVALGAAVSLLALVAAAILLRYRGTAAAPAGRVTSAAIPAVPRVPAVSQQRLSTVRVALVAVLLLGFGLRVYRLGGQELRGDEAFSFNFTQLPLAEVVPELIRQGDPHPPLHYLLLNVWSELAGESELALRYLSAAAGALLLAALYALANRMAGQRAGLVAAGLAAVSPGLIWLAQDARNQYALVMLFTALATLVIVSRPRKPAAVYWGLYVVTCALAVYMHYYGAFALAAHGLYLWLAPGRRRDLPLWAAGGALTLALLAPWLAATAQTVLGAGQLADPAQPELARHLTAIGRDLVIGQSLDPGLSRWLLLGGAMLAVGGATALARAGRREWAAMLVAWILLGSYAIFLVRFSRGTFNSFYGSIVAPAWWLLVAAALAALWRWGGRRRLLAALAFAVYIVAALAALGNYYFDPLHGRTLGYRQVVAHLEQTAGPDDALIIPFPDPGWDYYLRDSDLPRRMLPAVLGESAAETEAQVAQLAETHERLWFIPYSGWDAEDVVGRWLDYHMLSEERTAAGRMELRAYRPRHAAAGAMTPIGAQVGEELRLAAAHVTIDGRAADLTQATPAAPGAAVEVTLLWEGLQSSDRSYTVFVHLRYASGALIAQHDGIPAFGTRPTTTWAAGETLLDRHEMTLPPNAAGPVTVVVGLYDSETLEPRPFDGGETAVVLGELLVAR